MAEKPEERIVYGGAGKAARNWEAFDAIVARTHTFLCMLALYVRWHMERALQPLLEEDPRQSFAGLMMQLETLQHHTVEVAGQELELMGEPESLHQRISQLLGVPLA